MLKRTITSIGIIIVTAGFLLLRTVDNRLFDIFPLIISLVANFEFFRIFKDKTTKTQKILAYLFTVSAFSAAVFYAKALFAVILIFIAANLTLLVINAERYSFPSVAISIAGAFYPSLFLVALHFVNADTHYSNLILIFAVTPFADAGAYLIGSLLKGRKLCPKISPHKTVSGAIGGLFGGVLASVLVYFIFGTVIKNTLSDVLFYVFIGLICGVLTELGDVVESKIKREIGIKDTGNLLPGHGGMLDRIDGLTFASIAVYVIFCLLVPIL